MQDSQTINHERATADQAQLTWDTQSILRSGQHNLIQRILRVMAVLGVFVLLTGIIDLVTTGHYTQFIVIVAIYLILLVVTFTPAVTYGIQAGALIGVLYMIGVFNLVNAGQSGNGVLFLLAASVLASLLFGRRAGIILTLFVIATMVLFAFLFVTSTIYLPVDALPGLDDLNTWVTGVLAFILVGAMLTIPQTYIFRGFATALSHEQELTKKWESERVNLEGQIAERTHAVTQRARYLAASAVVASEAAGVIDDSGMLLRRVVNLISEQFGFYHTGLFLNSSSGEWAELKAASSEGGQKMLARSHRLRIGSQGIVGYVALRGEHRIALDVGNDAVFFNNPDLPDTRSEVALPLSVRGEVIGVLDVQSTESEAFDEDDIAVLQSLADQVALAISNARLFTLAQDSIETEQRLRGDLSRDGWLNLLHAEPNLRARSTASGVSSEDEVWTPEMGMALHGDEPVIDNETGKRIAMPVRIAGQTIGIVAARKSSSAEQWSGEEVRLLNTLTDQLNASVERVRLYRQAQMIASRQRTIAAVGTLMRSSLQLETMLQTAASEIREALELSDVEIRLASPVDANLVDNSTKLSGVDL